MNLYLWEIIGRGTYRVLKTGIYTDIRHREGDNSVFQGPTPSDTTWSSNRTGGPLFHTRLVPQNPVMSEHPLVRDGREVRSPVTKGKDPSRPGETCESNTSP